MKTSEMRRFVSAVYRMRDRQKGYFKERSREALIASRMAEKRVDTLLAEIIPPLMQMSLEAFEEE